MHGIRAQKWGKSEDKYFGSHYKEAETFNCMIIDSIFKKQIKQTREIFLMGLHEENTV